MPQPTAAPQPSDPFADLTAPLTVHASPRRRGLWHADPTCPRVPADAIAVTGPAGQLPDLLLAGTRLTACMRCTFPQLLPAAVEHGGHRTVLLCPRWCLGDGDSHARCPRCRALRTAAASRGLVVTEVPWPDSYPIVLASIAPQLRASVATRYALHDVPDDVGPLDADALAVAWARRRDPGLPMAGIFVRRMRQYAPLHTFDFTVASLVTAPPG